MGATALATSARPYEPVMQSARYFFDLNDGTEIQDEIGRVIDHPLALRREALRVISSLASAEAEDAKETTLVLSVRDEAGKIVLRIRNVCQVEEL